MNNKIIEIDSFNPYDSIYPNRKLVTRDTLNLIKTLRSEGYEVIVKPNDEKPIEYLFKKGESTFLLDPTIQLIIEISHDILIGLIINWVQKRMDNNKESKNIIIVNNSTNSIINSFNKNISKEELIIIKKKRKSIKKEFDKCLQTKSPFPGLPFPILLEHKPKIIGWCRLKETEKGLEMEKGIITDKNVYRKMKKGKYKGGSVTGIARKSICNICNTDYVNCFHIAGNEYNGKSCTNSIIEGDLIEVSIVKEPINKETFIKLL